jgi:copper transport protein
MQAKQWFFALVGALALLALPVGIGTIYAHAVLVRSEPVSNAQLTESPHEIRLWFTEPLEPVYSKIELRDATGAVVNTPPSHIEPTDEQQMVLMTGELAAGLYTVVWRNVSAADGHGTTGSFPFIIGAANPDTPVVSSNNVGLNVFDLLSRWINFWGLALAVGSIAFILFVWRPITSAFTPDVPPSLWVMVWAGWLAAGMGGLLLLINQAAILLGQLWFEVLAADKILGVISNSHFGTLWLWRMGLWLLMGLLLLAAKRSAMLAWLATCCSLAMLIPISMFSHAAVNADVGLSVASDWVHLAMACLWVGGLVQFLVAIPIMGRLVQPVTPKLGLLVAQFSNYVRVAVAGLILTGIYATWHLVNTLEALTTTFYGKLLGVKLALVVVLLVVAAVNLVWTRRRLLAGRAIWVGRLQSLIGIEVILVFAILLVVGAMTAINPAHNEIIQREAAEAAAAIPPAPQPQPIHMTADVDDMQIHFTAMPGWVGNNMFTVQLVNMEDGPVTNASLIRLRFEDQSEKLGESELQIRPPTEVADGVYSIEGANLSAAGDWHLRMTVQRPDAFDSVADFEFTVDEAPPSPPPPAPFARTNPVLPYRTPVLLLVGILAVLAGLYSLIEQRFHLLQGGALLASLLVILGVAFLLTGFLT